VLVIAPLAKLQQNTFYFAKYKELDISVLELIQMKYIETYKNLCMYLTYFSVLSK
jgi:hypothetical protein